MSSARPAITTFFASSFPHDDILAPSTSAPVSAARVPPTALLSRFPPSRASDDIKPAAAPPPSSTLVATHRRPAPISAAPLPVLATSLRFVYASRQPPFRLTSPQPVSYL
ncbi:hypothetical protein C8F04DRAFT_1275667 [Mycena alexandri]|uniref:Uncharacterized protein n=1 Tax=Mycena alexandri TaxID=1745969 RepID=A0AAD6WQI4_9AGAR|nr:hypothetical protein C8F04DRAFT_1275667 [Mycena alexandri]